MKTSLQTIFLMSGICLAFASCVSNASHDFKLNPQTGEFEANAVNEEHSTKGTFKKKVTKADGVVEETEITFERGAKIDATMQALMNQTNAIVTGAQIGAGAIQSVLQSGIVPGTVKVAPAQSSAASQPAN